MNIFEGLKQFKNIKPAAGFTTSSRDRILGRKFRLQDVIRQNASMAFATLSLALLFVFAGTQFFANFHVASVDPRGLRAEAQAIDIQIQLTNLNYTPPAGGNETTPATAAHPQPFASSEPSGGDGIDNALKALSE